jgi:hypothetical protein
MLQGPVEKMMMAQLRYFPISVELKVRYFVEKLGI